MPWSNKYCEICEWYDTKDGCRFCHLCGELGPDHTFRDKIYYQWWKFKNIYLTKRLDKR